MTENSDRRDRRSPAPTVTLSYEEKIINALARVTHKRADDRLTRDKKDFDAIREVLRPLYRERDRMREAIGEVTEHCETCFDKYEACWRCKLLKAAVNP